LFKTRESKFRVNHHLHGDAYRCSLDAALPVVENLQKYRYVFRTSTGSSEISADSCQTSLHINNWEIFWLFICFEARLVYFIKEYLATPWRVAVKYCHFSGSHVTGPDQGFLILVPRPKLGRPSQWPWFRLLICVGIPTQRLGRTAYAFLPKNMATTMNATVRGRQKQYILHLRIQIILKLS
jgi:hypothetical protein